MNPKEQFAAVKDMRNNGWELLGNFHSHPATPSRPSEEDIRLAFDPKASYLILSLKDDTPVLKSFNISSGQATQEELSIVGRKHRWQMLIIRTEKRRIHEQVDKDRFSLRLRIVGGQIKQSSLQR